MRRDEAEELLVTLRDAHGRAAAAMFGIDSHPGLGFLKAGGLRGRTAQAWAALAPDINTLWTDFNLLGDLLETARAAEGSRKVTETEEATLRRTSALAASLPPRCQAVSANLDAVDASWRACGAAVAPITEALDHLTRLASGVGERAGVTALEARAAALRDILADPLGAAPSGVLDPVRGVELSDLTADVATASARLSELAALRDQFGARVARLQTQIEAVRAAEASAAQACRDADVKIASSGLPPAPAASGVLRARVLDLDRFRQAKRWRRLADEVATLEASIARARDRAAQLRDAADGLLGRRDELRGRLEAYRAKAARHRLDEDETLAALHANAHRLLYTAPCDLPEATRAVFAYQTALTTLVKAHDAGKEAR